MGREQRSRAEHPASVWDLRHHFARSGVRLHRLRPDQDRDVVEKKQSGKIYIKIEIWKFKFLNKFYRPGILRVI